MATSRSGAGGKIVTNRRRQRLAVTPYDRPPPQPLPPPVPKSPNWFTGIIVPSARLLASGAGKIFSSIFSESESSSSEDEDAASEDDIDDDNHYDIRYDGANTLDEENVTSPEMMRYGHESQATWERGTKKIIEQLIMKETFSREECDGLIKILNSRVTDWSTEAGERSSVVGSPRRAVAHDVEKAIQEAKRWFQDKKVGPSSVTELAPGGSNLNSTALEHVEIGGGSPVDVARSYMKERPPWASPGGNVESGTPRTATMKLFKEGPLYSAGHDSLSSSKKRSSLASGSWNIQEELRRVRSRVTEDMLRSPSTRIDPSLSAVAQLKVESAGAGEKVSAMGERMTELASLKQSKPIVDAGVSSDPAPAAFDSRHDGKGSEGLLAKSATSVSGNKEVLETFLSDAVSKHIANPEHLEDLHADLHPREANGSPGEAVEYGGKENVNGLLSSQISLSAGVAVGKQHDNENLNTDTSNEKPTNTEGNCELLSEAYMEVPVVTETNSTTGGSQNSLGELAVDVAQTSSEGKVGAKQQARKRGRPRSSRGRGK